MTGFDTWGKSTNLDDDHVVIAALPQQVPSRTEVYYMMQHAEEAASQWAVESIMNVNYYNQSDIASLPLLKLAADKYDAGGEDEARELILEGCSNYLICRTILMVVKNVNILPVQNCDNWFVFPYNLILFDRNSNMVDAELFRTAEMLVTIPNLVLLYHELGHAKQLEEKGANYFEVQENETQRDCINRREMDNISRHERPLMEAMGIPFRKAYTTTWGDGRIWKHRKSIG